jgi:hypothetical protein
MSHHDDIVECVRKTYGFNGKQKEVDGFVDIAEDHELIEVELSGKPEKFAWAMLKLSKGEHGILFVLPEHLKKAIKYKESYGFDNIEIRPIPEECTI